jgi:hypothetical protein
MAKVAISENPMFLIEHKQAFGKKGNKYINLSFMGGNLPINIYENKQIASVYRVKQSQFDFNLARTFGTNWYLVSGLDYQKNVFNPEVAANLSLRVIQEIYTPISELNQKQLTAVFSPQKGMNFLLKGALHFTEKQKWKHIQAIRQLTCPDLLMVSLNFTGFYSIFQNSIL